MGPHDSSHNRLPTTYLTVLSIIGEGAKYGYEINKIIKQSGYREWADLQFSSVYKALSRLEDRGLIKGKKKDNRVKTSRKTYSLTRRGRNSLKDQIRACLSNPPQQRNLFDLGVASMHLLTQEEVVDALREYRKNLESSLKYLDIQIRRIEDAEQLGGITAEISVSEGKNLNNMGATKALFDRSASIVQCKMTWLDKFIEQVEDGDGFTFANRSRWW
ncbi:MAG: hypothetical protein DRO87_10560 [Candidatus Thorarchaeota archaeon]|nr:MAG: hypothetical protein DRO87_10560 [Candidatus Thorarchaeota archaeon]RLI58239.1 MAG: hypothetical protein DRP09_00440 [Candidatus Thorarchaeota archaeon]